MPELVSKLHRVNLANGRFSSTNRSDLHDLFENYRTKGAGKPLLVHFHGGLVNESSGNEVATRLFPEYEKAGVYPVFFVWESGLTEVVGRNVPEIFRERIFGRILHRALQFLDRDEASDGARAAGLAGGALGGGIEDLDRTKEKAKRAAEGEDPFERAERELANQSGELTPQERALIERELEDDDILNDEVRRIAAGALPPAERGTRGLAAEKGVPTLMDQEVVDELAGTTPDSSGQRGLISSARIIKGVVKVVARVVKRFAQNRDHGLYTTVVEEILREFYIHKAGGFVWGQMKKDTADAFQKDANVYGGTAFLDELAALIESGTVPCVVLVGHSTGAVYINELLEAAHNRLNANDVTKSFKFNVIFLAPAATFEHTAKALSVARDRIKGFRSFGMQDELEARDQLIRSDDHPGANPYLKVIYPRSLLYFVSGICEDEVDKPLVGMQRYHSGGDPYTGKHFDTVGSFLSTVSNWSVWSVAAGADGLSSRCESHGGFDNDPDTLRSVVHMATSACR